ncbi:MAG: TonB-dependent receptor [Pseudomonadota bacterium]|nr:TonB-dependent receptor [Pseudomonadota bacterium]
MFKKSSAVAGLLVFSILGVSAIALGAENEGDLKGRVVRTRDSLPLANISVQIAETGAKTITSAQGSYSFEDLMPGVYTVVVTPNTASEMRHKVTIGAGKTTHDDFSVAEMSALESIVVMAQRTPIAVARAAQMEAPNLVNITTYEEIRKLPDISVAEAVRRIPGISLETDEGEGRYINCRGLDADLNSTTFGGLRLPPTNNASPFGGYRAVTLDSIPTGLVGAITVTKSNLPSQDAEALGCTIEITPKTAPAGGAPFIQGNIGSGYEPLRHTGIIDVAVTAGGRFGGPGKPSDSEVTAYSDQPFSAVLTASYYDDKRGFDDVEPAYFDDTAQGAVPAAGNHPYDAISGIDYRYYSLHRKRHGYGIDLGYQPNANSSWYVRAFDAGYTEKYLRPYLHLTPDGNTVVNADGTMTDTLNTAYDPVAGTSSAIQKDFRDERETSRDRIFVLGGKNLIGGNTLDYRAGFTKGTWDKFYDVNTEYDYMQPAGSNITYTYDLSGQGHTPNQTIAGANYLDPTQYQLVAASNSSAVNFDKELSFAANFDMPVHWGGFDSEDFKVGASARLRRKDTTADSRSYPNVPPATTVLLSSVAAGGPVTYYNNRYPIGYNPAPGYFQANFGPGVVTPADVLSDEAQYLDAKENVDAAYGQYQMDLGSFGLVGGVRAEHTKDDSHAYQEVTDASGNTTASPVSASKSYTNWFPGLQAKYEIRPKLITRATWSSTLARPGFNQSNVSEAVDLGSSQITVGNPDLKPATANSFDWTIERYLASAGILSFGLFDKEFKNYIVPNQTGTTTFPGIGNPLRLFTFSNVGKSHSRGAEFNWEQRFKNLPGFLGGLGASANYTFVDSRIEIRPGEFSTLPSASKNTWNVAALYEQYGVGLRLAAYSTSADLFTIGSQKSGDVWNATRTSMDFGSTYAFAEHWSGYFNAKNLLNTPHKFYQGTFERVIQREFYGQTYQLGVRFDY